MLWASSSDCDAKNRPQATHSNSNSPELELGEVVGGVVVVESCIASVVKDLFPLDAAEDARVLVMLGLATCPAM